MMKNKTTTILMSVLIAFGMWLYVVTVENPNQVNTYHNVKVVFEGETIFRDRGLMLTSDPDIRVRVDLKSNRTNLNNINSDNLILKADLSDIDGPGEQQLSYTVSFPGNVSYQDVKVVNKQPGTITVQVSERKTKEIPVEVDFLGKLKENFIMDRADMVLDHDTITVEGPREVVEQISRAYIGVDCSGASETISESFRYELQDAEGNPVDASLIKTSTEQVRVEAPIVGVKQVRLKVNVNDGGGATADTSEISMDLDAITVSGSEAALAQIDELVVGTINLADIPNAIEKVFPITLPEGLTNRSGVTEVKVKISFPALSRRDFTITNIQTINLPAGKQVDLLTKQLTITVRGPKQDIQKLQASDITVQIDLTDVENTEAVEAVVIFAEPYQSVGVVGKYSISVTVTDAPKTGG